MRKNSRAKAPSPPRTPRRCWDGFTKTLEDANEAAKSYKPNKADWLEGHWAGFTPVDQKEVELTEEPTAVPADTLKRSALRCRHVPDEFQRQPEDRPPA